MSMSPLHELRGTCLGNMHLPATIIAYCCHLLGQCISHCVLLPYMWYKGTSGDCDCQWCCSVHIVMNSSGKPTGNGYVQFGSAEESKAAMAKDRKTLGSRYIELFPCSQEELAEAA